MSTLDLYGGDHTLHAAFTADYEFELKSMRHVRLVALLDMPVFVAIRHQMKAFGNRTNKKVDFLRDLSEFFIKQVCCWLPCQLLLYRSVYLRSVVVTCLFRRRSSKSMQSPLKRCTASSTSRDPSAAPCPTFCGSAACGFV